MEARLSEIPKRRSRRPNFTDSELLLFLKVLENNREVLLYDANLYGDDLKMAWDNLAIEYSSQVNFPRTGEELRHKFKDLKSRTKKRIAEINSHQRQTGGAPPKKLTEVENLVIQLAGENAMAGMTYYSDAFAEKYVVEMAYQDDVEENTQSIEMMSNDPSEIKESMPDFNDNEPTPSKIKAVGTFRNLKRKKRDSRQHKEKLQKENGQKIQDEEWSAIFKEKLAVSKEKLAIAKEQLAVSRERLVVENERLKVEKAKLKIDMNNNCHSPYYCEEYLEYNSKY